MHRTDIVIIGGGATGAGVLRDAALRGFRALLVDRGDFGTGTSGRYHGLLHSGARYAVKDPTSAAECIRENTVLRRIAGASIEDTGGLFLTTPADDPAYADRFAVACRAAGIPVQEISVTEALQMEPLLNPAATRAFLVPDAACDPWTLIDANLRAARDLGSDAWPYQEVVGLEQIGGRIAAVHLLDKRSSERSSVECEFVVNAAGAWAGQIGKMADVSIAMTAGKGSMIVMNHRLVNTVVNRCHLPADGDILVPVGSVSILGTTSIRVPDPDTYEIEPDEIDAILREGEELVPGISRQRSLRAFAGIRPLYSETNPGSIEGRDVSRSFAVLDHKSRDGLDNMVSLVGGKLTTYRLMAEAGMDAVCRRLDLHRPSQTAFEALPGSEAGSSYSMRDRLEGIEEQAGAESSLICECEFVTRARIEQVAAEKNTRDLDDIRRELRLGMGPCQGGFCAFRAAGVLHDLFRLAPEETNQSLCHFLEARWKGIRPVFWGDDLRQIQLDEEIFINLLGVDTLDRSIPSVDRPV